MLGNSLPDLSFGWTFCTKSELALWNDQEEGWCMSSYATYCRDQATDCTRRARLARSTDIAAYYEGLGLRWLRLAEHAQGTGGVVGQASEAIGSSSLRAFDLDARHNTCTSLKKLYQDRRTALNRNLIDRSIGTTASTRRQAGPARETPSARTPCGSMSRL